MNENGINPITDHILEIERLARENADKYAEENPEIYIIASELCRLAGQDPKQVVMGEYYKVQYRTARDEPRFLKHPIYCWWMFYASEAGTIWDALKKVVR